jgi:hypothetical protein
MGVYTEKYVFEGCIEIIPYLQEDVVKLINGLSETKRMKRDIKKLAEKLNISENECYEKYGIDGEFYYEPSEFDFEHHDLKYDETIVNDYRPPSTQPCQYLHWKIENNNKIVWDGTKKFQYFEDWIEYIIVRILKPQGYKCNGIINFVDACGLEYGSGSIIVKNNRIKIKY